MNWYKISQTNVQFARYDSSGILAILINGKRYEYEGVQSNQSSYIRMLIDKKNWTRLFPILQSLKRSDIDEDTQISLF